MKHTTMKKLLAIALAAVMLGSVLTGCGNNAGQSQESKTSEVQSSEAQSSQASASEAQSSEAKADEFEHDPILNELGTEPFVNEEVTITIALAQNANIENYDTNHYTTMLEEVSGVNIEFLLFPSGEAQEKLQMMVAGGEKLPDIIMWGISEPLAMQWGEEGYIIPLEDYFANSSYYAMEGYNRVKETSGLDILDYQTMIDGHIWQFPSYFESGTNPIYDRMWIYGPWLEALNLEEPRTTEELYEVLKAFKTQDPNGNGKADEIPMLGSELTDYGKGGCIFWEYCMNAFTHSTYQNNSWLISNDGQLSVSYIQDGWKEGVKYINKLVSEGLIDPVSFTQDSPTMIQIVNSSGDQIVGCHGTRTSVGKDHPSVNGWILLEPLIGPDGYCSTANKPDLPSNRAMITADCEHPEVAFRLMDLMCREDFTITARWGKQGENWDYVEDLKKLPEYADRAFDQIFLGCPAYFLEYKTCWNQPQNNNWMNNNIAFRTIEVAAGFYAAGIDPGVNSMNYQFSLHLDAYLEAQPKEVVTRIKYESADAQAEAELIANELTEYVYEKLSSWCLGVTDVEEEWDAYLEELEKIGLSDWLEICQAGWK